MELYLANSRTLTLLVFIVIALCATDGGAQTEWEGNPGNLVINLGPQGAWDSVHIFDPIVLFDGIEYRMWYSGDDGSNNRIGYATSVDGLTWKKHPDNPVIDLGPEGTWDGVYATSCAVIFDGVEYKMWYCGVGDNDPSNARIGYATSVDGIVWEKQPGNPVLDIGPGGSWDSHSASNPTVLFNGAEYKMWYSGYDDSRTSRIGYATSVDGVNWEKHPGNPIIDKGPADTWSQDSVAKPTVIFHRGEYMIWYSGHDRGPRGKRYRIGYSTSADGISWQEHPDNPVLDIGLWNAWDGSRVSGPTVLSDDTGYRMWYHGFDNAHWRIGYAEDASGGLFGVTPQRKLSTTWADVKQR